MSLVWRGPDGTRDEFHWSGGELVGPAGTYNELEHESVADVWRVRHKDQTYHEFTFQYGDGIGRLTRIVDATGNAASVEYPIGSPLRIVAIHAAGRAITFGYDANGRLASITDPGETDYGTSIADRSWTMLYDGEPGYSGWLMHIYDPMGYRNKVVYDFLCMSGGMEREPCTQWIFYGRLVEVRQPIEGRLASGSYTTDALFHLNGG